MKELKELCNELKLGDCLEEPIPVAGGLTHKMFRLVTNQGSYAVKRLNPNIMKRETAMINYARAEDCEERMKENGIPIVSALTFRGKRMLKLHGIYYYIYPWVEGKSLCQKEIHEIHCRKIAETLANIHNIEFCECRKETGSHTIDWQTYLLLAKQQNSDIVSLLESNLCMLIHCNERWMDSEAMLPAVHTICHNDMDSKNVLWQDGEPLLIDLECAGKSNPYTEMFDLALCWSGFYECEINWSLFRVFLKTYKEGANHYFGNAKVLYGCGFNRLDWLEFNVRRALLLCCTEEEELQLGVQEVISTIRQLQYYVSCEEKIVEMMEEL